MVSGFEIVFGSEAGNRFVGDKGDTEFVGGSGDDYFRGMSGGDILTGNGGKDTFAYLKIDTARGSVDTITDFQIGVDKLDMSDFAKGYANIADAVRFVDIGPGNTLVQGHLKTGWVDVAALAGVDIHDAGYGMLA